MGRASTTSITDRLGNPCGDPSREGGALRSLDLRTSGDPVTLDGPSCASTRRPAPALRPIPWATTPTQMHAASSPMACATRSASPCARARTTRSGSATSAGTTGKRSISSPTPRRGAAQLRLALLRRQRPPTGLRGGQPCDLPEPLQHSRMPRSRHSLRTRTPQVSSPTSRVPTGSSAIGGVAFESYSGGHLSEPLQRRAVLCRLLAQLHLGHAEPVNGRPNPRPSRPSWSAPPIRWT